MKRKLLYLIVLLSVSCTFVMSQYVPDTITLYKTYVLPEIDGEIDDIWEIAEAIEIVHFGEDEDEILNDPDASDFYAEFKMMWDGEYIYFLGVIDDDIVATMDVLDGTGAPDWETDSWEFYWAPSNTQLPDMTEMLQVRTAFANTSNENASSGITNGWSEGGFTIGNFVSAERALSDLGWVLEARFDLGPLAAAADNIDEFTDESIIGFSTNASDNDGEASRKWIGSWIEDAKWNEADTLGIIYLSPEELVGVSNNLNQTTISVYPNPTGNELYISGEVNVDALEIFNATGSKVFSETNFNNSINISSLKQGVYFVKVYADTKLVKVGKIIKN